MFPQPEHLRAVAQQAAVRFAETPFPLLLVHGIAVSRRKAVIGLPFFLIWMVFGLVAAGATVVTWILVSFLQDQFVDPQEAVRLFLLAFTCYPPLAAFFAWIERRLLPTA